MARIYVQDRDHLDDGERTVEEHACGLDVLDQGVPLGAVVLGFPKALVEVFDLGDPLGAGAHLKQPVLPALGSVSTWVTGQQYSPAAASAFLQIAYYYLVAQALASGHVVVTHEKPEHSVHRIKIPSVCIGLGVKHVTPFDMLRYERARFMLSGAKG